jgi:hypothetical protein
MNNPYFHTHFSTNEHQFNLVNLEIILDIFNSKLETNCPNLKLNLVFSQQIENNNNLELMNDNQLLLCLYDNSKLASYIYLPISRIKNKYLPININNNDEKYVIIISSHTLNNYKDKKYNKLLRSVIIALCCKIKYNKIPIDFIMSYAENPISAWILLKYYSTSYNKKFKNYISNKNITHQNITNYYNSITNSRNKRITIFVPLNEINYYKAIDNFHTIIESYRI